MFALGLFAITAGVVLLGTFAPHVFSPITQAVGRPIFSSNNWAARSLNSVGGFFRTKSYLIRENESLKNQVSLFQVVTAERDFFKTESTRLEELMGRIDIESPMVMARVLSKPDYSPYDTVVIDIGTKEGAKPGDFIFADETTILGELREVYGESSTAVLYSSSREKIEVLIGTKSLAGESVGLGGGTMQIKLPRDTGVAAGDIVQVAKKTNKILGTVSTLTTSASDSFEWALLRSPINISELRYVFVEKKSQ